MFLGHWDSDFPSNSLATLQAVLKVAKREKSTIPTQAGKKVCWWYLKGGGGGEAKCERSPLVSPWPSKE